MKVEKLIEQLKKMPQDKDVYFYVDDLDYHEVNGVFTDQDGDIGLIE